MQCFFDFARLPDIYCFCCSIHPAFPYNCLYLIFWETTSTKSLKDTISVKILVRKLNNFPNSYYKKKIKHFKPDQKKSIQDLFKNVLKKILSILVCSVLGDVEPTSRRIYCTLPGVQLPINWICVLVCLILFQEYISPHSLPFHKSNLRSHNRPYCFLYFVVQEL